MANKTDALTSNPFEMEPLLNETELRYRQLVHALPAAIYTCDDQGRILLYNRAAALLWGREPEIGKDLWCGSWRIFRPDGSPLPLDTCPMAVALKEGKPVYGEEIIIERPDGVRRNVLPHPRPIFDSSGKVVQAVNMLVDITEHKKHEQAVRESEELFRTMAEQAPVIIFLADVNGRISYLNSKWVEFTGKPVEQGYGNGLMNFIHPEDCEWVRKRWVDAATLRQPFDLKFRFHSAESQHSFVRVSGTPRFNSLEEFAGYIGVLQDITLQELTQAYLEKQVEDRTKLLQKSNEDLEESNTELEAFACVASHDLQEPLRKIRTFAEMVEANLEDEKKVRTYIKKITDASGKMMFLIRELLNFSKLSKTGHLYSQVNLNGILETVKDDFELLIQEHDARIENHELPVIEGVALHLNQLFNNLISNSLKFRIADTKPVIRINSRRLSKMEVLDRPALNPELDYFDISFQDNGIGFSQENAEEIFTIFQRLHNRQSYQGTGIGLAVCKKIVNNHQGDIYAVSNENEGATFHVILPEHQKPAGIW